MLLFLLPSLVPAPMGQVSLSGWGISLRLWRLLPPRSPSLFRAHPTAFFQFLKHTKLSSSLCLEHAFPMSLSGWLLSGFRFQLKCHLASETFADHPIQGRLYPFPIITSLSIACFTSSNYLLIYLFCFVFFTLPSPSTQTETPWWYGPYLS